VQYTTLSFFLFSPQPSHHVGPEKASHGHGHGHGHGHEHGQGHGGKAHHEAEWHREGLWKKPSLLVDWHTIGQQAERKITWSPSFLSFFLLLPPFHLHLFG
jgi:hypothetical protein